MQFTRNWLLIIPFILMFTACVTPQDHGGDDVGKQIYSYYDDKRSIIRLHLTPPEGGETNSDWYVQPCEDVQYRCFILQVTKFYVPWECEERTYVEQFVLNKSTPMYWEGPLALTGNDRFYNKKNDKFAIYYHAKYGLSGFYWSKRNIGVGDESYQNLSHFYSDDGIGPFACIN